MRRFLMPWTAILMATVLAACAGTPRERAVSRGLQADASRSPDVRNANPEHPPRGALPVPVSVTEVAARQRRAQAASVLAQARVLMPASPAAGQVLAGVDRLLAQRNWSVAASLAAEWEARAHARISDHYARLAQAELRAARNWTGLDAAQLERLRAAEEAVLSGNSRLGYQQLSAFNREAQSLRRPYTVRAGDSLWRISARPETYANPRLWPLIYDSNRDQLPHPDRVRAGQTLRVRPHPSLDEVVQALESTGGITPPAERGVVPRIGVIREAAP